MNITRGDTKTFIFQRKDINNQVIAQKPDEMYITIKRNTELQSFIIQKRLNDGSITYDEETNYYSFTILPIDTNNLEYGDYKYDIEIIEAGKVRTIKKGIFTIEEEVTFASNEVGYE